MTRKRIVGAALAAALASMLVVSAQATAISRGVPDGVFQGCGATLVSETVLVTAAHCLASLGPGSELRVDFGADATPNDPGWFAPVGAVADPEFSFANGASLAKDFGVVLLAPGQAAGRPVAQLPTRNLLGVVASQNGL